MSIPLFDPKELKTSVAELGETLSEILKGEAENFILRNQADAALLGKEAVEAILFVQVFAPTPVMILPSDASPAVIAAAEEILTKRSRSLQLVAQAQKENNAVVARVQKNAVRTATQITSVIVALGIKALLTGGQK